MEGGFTVPQKVKHRMTVSSSISTSGYIPRKIESKDLKDTCISVIMATLFTTEKSNPTVH